jgi:hypothetical protein
LNWPCVVGPAALDSVDHFFEWIDRFRLGKDVDNSDSKSDRQTDRLTGE